MKKSLILTLLFILPFIVMTVGIELLLRNIPNHYMMKADYLNKNSENIKILVLGSSHGVTAIDPAYLSKPGYNTANYAQSLDIDYLILDKYKNQLDSLEYIILPVSYHSLWTKLKYHSQQWRVKYYDIYYDIRLESKPNKRLLLLDQTIKKDLEIIKEYYVEKNNIESDTTSTLVLSPLGLALTKPQTNLTWINSTIEDVVAAHSSTDLDFMYDENVSYLEKIIDIAKEKNVKVIFVTIPAHEIFVERLHPDQLNLLYKTMNKLTDGKNVFYYNMLKDFTKEDQQTSLKYFCDADHLSYVGAKKFTLQLDSIVKILDQSK